MPFNTTDSVSAQHVGYEEKTS